MADRPAPLAVVGRGDTLTARLLRDITGLPVERLTPCQAALSGGDRRYRGLIVENFDDYDRRLLSPCGAARWLLSPRADVTVVALDDREGQRLAACAPGRIYSYSDGLPQADLTAEQVRVRDGRMEFIALSGLELTRVRVIPGDRPRLYDCLAALAGALALGMPLEQAADRLSRAMI